MSSPPSIEESLLADLNEPQQAAVTHGNGPLLVVAGAGTGKTRVLTRRVGWLITQGVAPWSLLAITFTNKAAGVLKQRLADLPGGEGVWAGTFHSFGAFLLRRHGETIGLDPRFTILDREDQQRLVKSILQEAGGSRELRPRDLIAAISHHKNGGGRPLSRDLRARLAGVSFEDLLERYATRLRAGRLLDFDDLLLEPVRLLDEVDEVRELYRERFRHVLVDEYQDTNVIQRELLVRLLNESRNLTVVGDPDQSIYRWRGAVVRNILEFESDFTGATKVLLEQNYRSTKTILEAAESVIEKNLGRHAKRLHTDNAQGGRVRVYRALNGEHEGHVVAEQIDRWIRAGRRLDEIAVFYRVNAISRSIETALRAREIPYVVVAGVEFFQRREVKDVLAYARLIENPHDEAAFLRVVNVPRRGVGQTSLERLRIAAARNGQSLFEAAGRTDNDVTGRARKGLRTFLDLIGALRAERPPTMAKLLLQIVERAGYREWLESSDDELERSRVENVEELIAFGRDFDEQEDGAELTLFLERTALVADQDDYDEAAGRVSLMSVHAAKGLEFPCVLIGAAETGYFPHARSLEDYDGVEEERRLFYVAMTRAKEELVATCTQSRQTYRGTERRRPSPYLLEIPPRLVEPVDRVGSSDFLAAASSIGWSVSDAPNARETPPPADTAPADDAPVREVGGQLSVGCRVRHPYFGEGLLFDIEGRGRSTYLTVDFEGFGRKRMSMEYARLERIQ